MTKQDVLPIKRIISEHHLDRERVLNRGDRVRCYCCGKPIIVKTENIFLINDGDYILLGCPHCGNKVEVFYYFDRVIDDANGKHFRAKVRYHSNGAAANQAIRLEKGEQPG